MFTAQSLQATRDQISIIEQGQITERFSRGVEQLGQDSIEMRLGGIYALERVARDSASDHPTVIELLAAFVRERTSIVWDNPNPQCDSSDLPPADIQAAVTAIGRRNAAWDTHPVNLRFTCLNRVDLRRADLAYADLSFSSLSGADLRDANFYGASLLAVSRRNTLLCGANSTSANIYMSDRTGAQESACGER